ncbi:hypothetical protein EYF80_015526 [Liparis tanakae]|uniref:Uncharacterized protein n=1 Tax=Liparis tanakae TaxID=230148 RepID=A0A4Z2IAX6_9TELE|nr:hypothetical protein EYF80_015526 [Liparis tanakae]
MNASESSLNPTLLQTERWRTGNAQRAEDGACTSFSRETDRTEPNRLAFTHRRYPGGNDDGGGGDGSHGGALVEGRVGRNQIWTQAKHRVNQSDSVLPGTRGQHVYGRRKVAVYGPKLARLQAPASRSLLSSFFLSSACSERISCEDDLRAGMDVRVLFEGENRRAAERKRSN